LYDPSNCGIVSCSQADWDLATKIMHSGRMTRLRDYAEFFQGEVNETNERKRGALANGPKDGTLVNRGAGICLYVLREESQGEALYLDVDKFLAGKGEDTKAYHHRQARVALQESSPQNNFRRIIAALAPRGRFFNHTVNYCPEARSVLTLQFIVAILNSKLADWYFRLGSTNAHVSHYQLYNLPCPRFADSLSSDAMKARKVAITAIRASDTARAFRATRPMLLSPPFSPAVQEILVNAVDRIIDIEHARAGVARTDRSALAPEAQPFQDFIDRVLYAMAGLSEDEAAGLEDRLSRML